MILALGLVVLGFAGWVILSTHPTISSRRRRLFDAIGRSIGKQVLLWLVIFWLIRHTSGGLWRMALGVLVAVLWYQIAASFSRQLDALKVQDYRSFVPIHSIERDCLTHFEIDFFIRNFDLLVSRRGEPYARELFKMKRHLDCCNECRYQLRRDEILLREWSDPDES